jgi:ureidoacrylate peracid hydrolase
MTRDGSMDDYLGDRLRRKLIKRRGRLHVFEQLLPAKTAIVVIDAVASFLHELPERDGLVVSINAATADLRERGGTVAWVRPTPPSTWRSASTACCLLGREQVERHDLKMKGDAPGGRIDEALVVHDRDIIVAKTGYSAFFPGNCALPAMLQAKEIDTVIFLGVLTNICVEASARDAYEMGYRVLICSDGVAAGTQEFHQNSLRTLARAYGDVRSTMEIRDLIVANDE